MKILKQNPTNRKSVSKILRFNLLRKKIYDVDLHNYSFYHISLLDKHIRSSFRTILKYHHSGRAILFVGIPSEYLQNCLQKMPALRRTHHVFLPKGVWVRGSLTNKKQVSYLLKSGKVDKKIIRSIRKVKNSKKFGLIVVFSSNTQESIDIMREGHSLRIPLVFFNNNFDPFFSLSKYFKPDLRVLGNFNFKEYTTSFFIMSLINSTIRKI